MDKNHSSLAAEQPKHKSRDEEILFVLNTAFGDLLEEDPSAFKVKFRKMAASAFAFYRGTACLFYHDLQKEQAREQDQFLTQKTSRVWIHGDLHAENFGTYMGSHGCLVFSVNDFDEAYIGPFTWDLKRFAASIALIGYSKALSDNQISKLIRTYTAAYREQIIALATSSQDGARQFSLDTATGPLFDALRSARLKKRSDLLNSMTEIRDYNRRFRRDDTAVELEPKTRKKVESAFSKYLTTLTEHNEQYPARYRIKDVVGRRGVGIGSAGLPSYNVLLEGASQALENDIVIYMKQAQSAVVSQHLPSEAAQAKFQHEGHRTVMSQRALQAYTDPWLGWTEIDGLGQLVAEVSPYSIDLDWSGLNDFQEMAQVVAHLGTATAMMHGAGDTDSRESNLVTFCSEKAIEEAIARSHDKLEDFLVDFAHSYGSQVRHDHSVFLHLFRNGHIPGLPVDEKS